MCKNRKKFRLLQTASFCFFKFPPTDTDIDTDTDTDTYTNIF